MAASSPNATDEDLEKQAEEMAAKALPASLPESVRVAKLPAVKEKILSRLKAQRTEQAAKAVAIVPSGLASGPPPPPGPPGAPQAGGAGASSAPPPPGAPPPPPPEGVIEAVLPIDGVEQLGDEPWFADVVVRRRLRESVADAHKEQKILVGQPADEVDRICPSDGRILGAGGVLRLGGAHLGGYGENDVAYAYRQLSRALHPDKNPDIPKAPAAFHRLSEAADELRQGLTDQRAALQLLVTTMGGQATPEMVARPQEALMAEACRMLIAVCGGVGEGEVPVQAQARMMGAFVRSNIFHTCMLQALLAEWFERSQLLDVFASTTLRTAYDCAPKRFRAQFLCLLNRAVVAEARRCNGCVRGQWSQIMQTFPELGIWREFREMLQNRVWDTSKDPPEAPKPKSKSRSSSRKKSRERERERRDRSRSRSRSRRRRRDGDGDGEDRRRGYYEREPRSGGGVNLGNGDPKDASNSKERDLIWDNRWRSSDDTPGVVEVQQDWKTARESKRNCKKAIESHPQSGARACRWARKWRCAMAAVLPSGLSGASSHTDKEVRKLGAALWKDIAKWAATCEAQRGLSLFRADHQTSKTFGWDGRPEAPGPSRGLDPDSPPAEWAFVPLADLILVVGEGLVGCTVEGMLAESPIGHRRRPFSQCYKKGSDGKRGSGRRGGGESQRLERNGDRSDAQSRASSKWDQQ